MTRNKYGDDFRIGDVHRTAGITVTETHVVNWAGLTGDFYPLHMTTSTRPKRSSASASRTAR